MWYPKIAPLNEVLNEMATKCGYGSQEELIKDIEFYSHKGKRIDPKCLSSLMNKTATVDYFLRNGKVVVACFLKPLGKRDNVIYEG